MPGAKLLHQLLSPSTERREWWRYCFH